MTEKILIVDDDKTVLDVIKRIIKKIGYSEVYLCATTIEAREFATNLVPDLIISDFDLCEMSNGVDLARCILWSTKKEIPVIIMSG